MPVRYKNCYGKIYYLCVQHKNGQTHYFFSRKRKYRLATEMPDGYYIHENKRGDVTLRLVGEDERDQLVPCPRCKQKVKKARLQEHLERVHGRTQPLKPGYKETANGEYEVPCRKCGRLFPSGEIGEHIRTAHYSSMNIPHEIEAPDMSAKMARRERERRQRQEAEQRESRAARRRELAVHVEPFECGWCYEPVFRVLQKNGYYRYYDDSDLMHKHRCTRPANWRPDKS